MSKRYRILAVSIAAGLASLLSAPGGASAQTGACCADFGTGVLCIGDLTEFQCTVPSFWGGPNTTCSSVGPFGNVNECGLSLIRLPVELVSFEAVVQESEVVLVWSTASEKNNAGFSVEYEVGEGVFAEVDFVTGNGTTEAVQEYSYAAGVFAPGMHRFRLKQVDFDGAFEHSPIVEAAVTVPSRFLIESAYPNPFNPSTTVRFAVATEQDVEVRLVNAAGQTVQTLHRGVVAANEMRSLAINAASLPSGTYLVHFKGERGLEATETIVLAK